MHELSLPSALRMRPSLEGMPRLARAVNSNRGISVFAVSTFDADYQLVKEQDLEAALDALRQPGHTIQE